MTRHKKAQREALRKLIRVQPLSDLDRRVLTTICDGAFPAVPTIRVEGGWVLAHAYPDAKSVPPSSKEI